MSRWSEAAAYLAGLRYAKRQIACLPEALKPGGVTEGMAIACEALGSGPAGAWKLGGTNAATRALFGTPNAYAGPLTIGEIYKQPITPLRLDDFVSALIEPEWVIAFDRDFSASPDHRVTSELRCSVAWIAPGFEIPDTVIEKPVSAGLPSLLADRCAAGALVIGPQLPAARIGLIEQSIVDFHTPEGRKASTEQYRLIGGVLGAASSGLAAIGRHGIGLSAGTPISLGGLTPVAPLRRGAYRMIYDTDTPPFSIMVE